MARIIDYPLVLETLNASGLHCVYPNSGAFGIPADQPNHIVGWITAEDATIRPAMRALAKLVHAPASRSLAMLLNRAWQQHLPGLLWLMPASHWSYELQFGNAEWLSPLLGKHGIDASLLQTRSDGAAIEFSIEEDASFTGLIEELFDRLAATDFTIAFPARSVVATLHHHRQIWWQTSDETLAKAISVLTAS